MPLPRFIGPLVLLIPLQLPAAPTDTADCGAPTTQSDMNRCAYADFLAANGALAAALKGLARGLPVPDRQRLQGAQKAWIAWRTAQCDFETGGSSGGSADAMAHSICIARLTHERTTALEALARCPEGDIACPRRRP